MGHCIVWNWGTAFWLLNLYWFTVAVHLSTEPVLFTVLLEHKVTYLHIVYHFNNTWNTFKFTTKKSNTTISIKNEKLTRINTPSSNISVPRGIQKKNKSNHMLASILTANVALQHYQKHSIHKQHCNIYIIFISSSHRITKTKQYRSKHFPSVHNRNILLLYIIYKTLLFCNCFGWTVWYVDQYKVRLYKNKSIHFKLNIQNIMV